MALFPWQDRNGRASALKALTFALLFVPAIWTIYGAATGAFGALVIGPLTFWSGVWATAFLLAALAVTPAMTILRWPHLFVIRRMLGVTALFYTVAHLFIYFALRFWDFGAIAVELVTRVSLIIAMITTAGIAVLTATSLDSAVKRMGAAGWQRLHNTVYAITLFALIHFLLSPDIYGQQYLMSGMFFWLMGWRQLQRRRRGTNPLWLALLAFVSAVFTMALEALWIWVYQGFEPVFTLMSNFDPDLAPSAAFQVLGLGLVIAAVAAIRQKWPRPMGQMTSA